MNDGRNGTVKQIICIKWGTKFGPEFVNRLHGMVARNITPPFRLYCFTDDGAGLHPDIAVRPLPEFEYQAPVNTRGKWPKSRLWGDLGDVTGVFFGSDFVSVTAAPGTDWSVLKPDILGLLLDHFTAQMPLFRLGGAAGFSVPAEDAGTDDPADADIVAQIRELIDTRVRPAVANDGGDIVYRGFDKGKVFLRMQGACAGCPSSSATLKQGIEQLLRHYVPEVTEVRAV